MDGKEIIQCKLTVSDLLFLFPRYPYPLFEQLSAPQRVTLFLFSATMMCLNTIALKWTYEKLNGKVRHAVHTPQRAKGDTANQVKN